MCFVLPTVMKTVSSKNYGITFKSRILFVSINLGGLEIVKFYFVLCLERGVISGRIYLKFALCDVKYQYSSNAAFVLLFLYRFLNIY